MKLLVVSEGVNELGREPEGGALPILVRRLAGTDVTIACEEVRSPKVHIHSGKGSRLFKRLLAWIRRAGSEGFDGLVLVIDRDGDQDRDKELNRAKDDQRLTRHDVEAQPGQHRLVLEALVELLHADEGLCRPVLHDSPSITVCIIRNSLARKKLLMKIASDAATTVFVVACPTPVAPPLVLRPL